MLNGKKSINILMTICNININASFKLGHFHLKITSCFLKHHSFIKRIFNLKQRSQCIIDSVLCSK